MASRAFGARLGAAACPCVACEGLSCPVSAARAATTGAALFELSLARQQFAQFALERVLVEQPAACGFVDLSASLGEAAFVSALDFRLMRDDRGDEVLVQEEIGRCGGGPQERERRKGQDRP